MSRQVFASRLVVLGGLAEELRCQPAALEIEDGLISAAHPLAPGPYDDQLRDLERSLEVEVLDFGERAISPAFVNGHTHLALGFLRAFDVHGALAGNVVEELFFRVEERMTPEDVRAFARMGAFDNLLHGVGLVWDHYYEGEAVAAALRDTGLAGVVAPTLQDLAGPGRDAWEAQLEATARIAEEARWREAGVFAALGPHATDTVSAELWRRAGALAAEKRLPLHAHVAQSIEEVRRAWERHGRSPMGWLVEEGLLEGAPSAILTHCLYASREDLEGLDPERDVIGFCPYAQRVFGFPAHPGIWEEVGLRFVLGTDVAAGNDSSGVQGELRALAEWRTAGVVHGASYREMIEKGDLDHAEAVWRERRAGFDRHGELARRETLLGHVWSVPGALHPAFRAGALEPGALANLAVWDREHPAFWPCPDGEALLQLLALGAPGDALHGLWVLGRPIGEPGDFQRSVLRSSAYREALAEAEGRLARLTASR